MRRKLTSPKVRTAWLVSVALIALAAAAFIPNSDAAPKTGTTKSAGRVLEPKEYDRLDGHGATAKKVDFIEWEGNFEVHVYPKGSLKTLGMKIDHESKSTKGAVMVMELGFQGVPYTLIRRAPLFISLPDAFQAFQDETTADYDKIIVSGHSITGVKKFTLHAPPTQLYPDYHPALTEDASLAEEPPAKPAQRKSASESVAPAFETSDHEFSDRGTVRRRHQDTGTPPEESRIKNFAF